MILLKAAGAGTGPKVIGDSTVSFVGGAIGTTSATLPAHVAGDLIVGFAWNNVSTDIPSNPSGWTSLFSGSASNPPTYYYANRCSWIVAADSSTTSGSWFNATTTLFAVFRGQRISSPPVALRLLWRDVNQTQSTITYQADTFDVTDSTSSLAFLVHRASTDTGIDAAPRYCDNEYAANQGSFRGAIHLSRTGLSGYHDSPVSVNSADRWVVVSLEIYSEPV